MVSLPSKMYNAFVPTFGLLLRFVASTLSADGQSIVVVEQRAYHSIRIYRKVNSERSIEVSTSSEPVSVSGDCV